jgi:hypothetical protein
LCDIAGLEDPSAQNCLYLLHLICLNTFANISWPNEEARSAAADWLHIKLLTDLEQLDALDEAEPLGQA